MPMVSRSGRLELIGAVSLRYVGSTRAEKARILDEFVAISGYHRKHAIRLLTAGTDAPESAGRAARPRVYDEAVHQALVVLWEASDRICGKRLRPLLPLLINSLEQHGHLQLDAVVREKLLRIGAATIDRLLAPTRSPEHGGGRRQRPRPAIRGQIPVRTFADWGDPQPGFMEIDLVAHGGGGTQGSFAHTLTLTDIASGWTECVALAVREASLVVKAISGLRCSMPFPLRGVDTDNGTEFVNDALLQFSQDAKIEFTRGRPYRKNDQAWVEQKNGSVVRRMVGYGRLEGLVATEALARLYDSTRLFVNFFQPSFKLRSKERVGARVRKNYYSPETPCARLLGSEHVTEASKERLRAVLATLDPLRLLDEIRTMQQHLAGLAAGDAHHIVPHRDLDLDRFMASLSTAWRAGEVRPTHKPNDATLQKGVRRWRTHVDAFADTWPTVLLWLENEPDRTAKELLGRLLDGNHGPIHPAQLRTLQRRVKEWRKAAAQRLVFSPAAHASAGLAPATPAPATPAPATPAPATPEPT